MENGQKTIRQLFDGTKIFRIPRYQRAYAWEKKQLEDFVDDIENQESDKDYFFGTILFQENGKSDDFDNIDIVDGQQRITTLVIFMKLLFDQLQGHREENEINKLKDRYIQIYGEYKLQVLQYDNDFFKTYILQDNLPPDGSVRTPSQERLLDARNNLRERLEKYSPEILWEFRDKIERTKVLTYSVNDNAEATLIFETTNDRGKSLTNLEKTKSFLMYKTYLASDSPDNDLNSLQGRFGEIYREYEVIKARVDEDSILQYHFIAFEKWDNQGERQRHVQTIKNTVNKLVNGNRSGAMAFIKRYSLELEQSFTVIKSLIQKRESHLLDIYTLGRQTVFYPLLAKAYKLDNEPDKQNFERVTRLVEIICFRVFGIRRRRADTGRDRLYGKVRDFDGKFDELINDLKKFVDDYCNNDDFSRYLSSSNFHNEIVKNDQYYLFWKYENHLRSTARFPEMSHEEFANRDPGTGFSIEHIIPQNPRESMVVVEGSESILPEITQEFKDEYLHCIGNLTIDPRAANSSKMNHSFEYKDQRHFCKAPLKTQNELSEFINRETRRWDKTSIDQRKEKILEFAINHWNHDAV